MYVKMTILTNAKYVICQRKKPPQDNVWMDARLATVIHVIQLMQINAKPVIQVTQRIQIVFVSKTPVT